VLGLLKTELCLAWSEREKEKEKAEGRSGKHWSTLLGLLRRFGSGSDVGVG